MITIHREKETEFSKNGYGAIDDYVINPEVYWEMNGQFSAYLEYPAFLPKADYLINKNILRIPVPFMDDQLFRIYRTRKVLGFIQVEARHIFYDLMDNLIEDTNIVGKNGLQAIQQLLSATQYGHQFTGLSNITTTNNARMVRYNPVEALLDDTKANTFVSRWGGEIVRDNFMIRMAKQMGSDRGVHIQHKKDLLGYEATIDESTVVTRIMPIGFDGLKLPELYIDSPLIDLNNPKIKVIKYDDVKAAIGMYAEDEDAIPVTEAYALLRKYAKEEFSVNHLDEPETTVRVNFASLHNTKEYEEFSQLQEIKQGDVVKVSVPEEGFEITSRLVAFTSDPLRLNHYTSTTLGNHVFEFTSSSNDTTMVRNEVEQLRESVVTALQSANGKNRNFWGTADPNTLSLNASVGDNYFRENGEETTLYQYVELNGERYWKEILDTSKVSIVAGKVDEAIAEAEQAKEEAQNAYKNALTDAVAEAERLDNERQLIIDGKFEVVNKANEKLEQSIATAEQNAQDALTKAGASEDLAQTAKEVSENALANIGTVQTELGEVKTQASDSLIKAQEALDATGTLSTKVESYEETVDGYKSEVANYSKTNETLTAKVKSYEETVDGYTQSLTRVEGKVDNLQIGGRNLLKGTSNSFETISSAGVFWNAFPNMSKIPLSELGLSVGDEVVFSGILKATDTSAWLRLNIYVNEVDYHPVKGNKIEAGQTGISEVKVTIPANTKYISFAFDFGTAGTKGTTIKYKELKLERGNVRTDWTLAEEDKVTQSEYTVYQNQVKSTTDEHTRRLTALDGADGRVTKVEQTANGIQQSLTDYAKKTYVDTTVETTAKGINTQITNIEKTIPTSFEGRNLQSGSNDFSVSKWFKRQNINTISTTYDETTKWTRVVASRIDNNSLRLLTYPLDLSEIEIGEKFSVSFDFYSNVSAIPYFNVKGMVPIDQLTWSISREGSQVAKRIKITGVRSTYMTSWTELSFEHDTIYANYDFNIRYLKVEKGIIPTEWTPHISDNVSRLEFQKVQETSKLYERVIGTTETDLKSNIGRIALTDSLFQTEVAKVTDKRNMLKNSWYQPRISNSQYNVLQIPLAFKPTVGKEYVFRICGTLNNTRTKFALFNSGGSVSLGEIPKANHLKTITTYDGTIQKVYELKFVWKNTNGTTTATDTSIYVYSFPNGDVSNTDIYWATLVEGTVGIDWSPSNSDLNDVSSKVTQISNSWALTIRDANGLKTAINATTDGIRLKGNLITLDGLVNMTSSFIVPEGNIGNLSAGKITSGTIDSARIDAKTIVTDGLEANVIKSTHILADEALFTKLFTNDLATEKLATKQAWIKSSMIGEAQIGTAQIGQIDASNGRIINLDASSITSGTMTANRINGGALTSTNGSTTFDLNTGQLSFQQDGVAIKNQFSGRPLQYLTFKTGTYAGSQGSYTALMSNSGNIAAMDKNSAGIQIWNNFDKKTAITLYGNVITFRHNADVNVTNQIDIDTVNNAIKHVNTINDLRIVPMSLSGTSGVALMYGNDAGMWIGGYGDFAFKHNGSWIGKASIIN